MCRKNKEEFPDFIRVSSVFNPWLNFLIRGDWTMHGMPIRTRLAFGCYLFIALAALAVGLRYTLSPRIMSYHQQALGVDWDDLGPREQGLLLALLRGTGLCALVTGNAIGILLVPFQRGEGWARWAITALCLIMLVPATCEALALAEQTGASTPWPALVGGIVVVLAGFWLGRPTVAIPGRRTGMGPGAAIPPDGHFATVHWRCGPDWET